MSTTAERKEFADKVRALYLEHYGDDAFKGADVGEFATLGPVLFMVEAQYLDGETGLITFYEGSFNTCLGMASRFVSGDYRDDDG